MRVSAFKRLTVLFTAVCLIGVPGCGGGTFGVGTTVPVQGRITVDGAALAIEGQRVGKIWFYPDTGRGNRCPQVALGTVDGQGNYRLFTRDLEGAAPGWYKVMIVAMDKDSMKDAKPLVPWKYTTIETSGLAIEVVEQPGLGAYDLRLTARN